jgi:hypothetical protein
MESRLVELRVVLGAGFANVAQPRFSFSTNRLPDGVASRELWTGFAWAEPEAGRSDHPPLPGNPLCIGTRQITEGNADCLIGQMGLERPVLPDQAECNRTPPAKTSVIDCETACP